MVGNSQMCNFIHTDNCEASEKECNSPVEQLTQNKSEDRNGDSIESEINERNKMSPYKSLAGYTSFVG